jgi:hypothetical protein
VVAAQSTHMNTVAIFPYRTSAKHPNVWLEASH